jgi:diphthine-ammonia ligase
VLRAHPDVKGVAVGAILSTYQRVRVEHVCSRLGLTALAYLWQRDQMNLLHEMREAGLDARIIKVAGAGLGERHLGQNVAGDAMIGELTRLVRAGATSEQLA